MNSHFARATLLSVVVAITSLCSFPNSSLAQTYLTDQDMFSAAWAKLVKKAGSADLFVLGVGPDQITAQIRPRDGAPLLDSWKVARRKGFFARDRVSGPVPVRPSGPIIDISPGFFAQSEVPFERFLSVLQAAEERVLLATPGRVSNVRIARQVTFGDRIGLGDIRWQVRVGNEREWGTVQALSDGTILGADISHTLRGQNRNFLAQDDWPFDEVEQGFRNILGDGEVVYEIKVLWHGIEVKAVSKDGPDKTNTYRWNGGMFTNPTGLATPNLDLIRPGGNLPFDLNSTGLARLPAILAAAKAAVPDSCGTVDRAEVVRPRPAAAKAQTVWVIELKENPKSDEKCVVQLTSMGRVVTASLPQSQRDEKGYLSGAGLLAGLNAVQTGLGSDTPVFEVTFRANKVDIQALDQSDPSMTLNLSLGASGLRHGMAMPLMMQTKADLIPLSQLATLDPTTMDKILGEAVRRLNIPGAEVHRVKMWSGAPFRSAPNGASFVDVRVGVPPRHSNGGYVVFTLDGQFVEMFK